MNATDLDRIVSALEGKREGSSWRCRCPAHEGHSLIATERDGKVLVKCHGGCDQEAVITALRERGLWPNGADEARQSTNGQPEAEYLYADEEGAFIAVKGRFRKPNGEKTFAWKRFGADAWNGLGGLKERDLPLYNAHLLPTDGGPTLMVEGEKAANACLDAGMLAVCPPGGASAKDFGDQPKALVGRDVILWPDNDDEGRALMQRMSLRLQGVAASIRTISPEVPPRGDAHDYFQAGGTKEALLVEAAKIKTAPWLEETATGYLVGIPESGGAAMFRFDSLEERSHVLQAEVTAWVEIPGMTRERFAARLNLLSLGNRDQFRRQLEDVVPLAKGAWTGFLNKACEMVRQAYAEADPTIELSGISGAEVAAGYVIRPLVLEDGPTISFGTGGTAKTYLGLAQAVCIGKGRDFLGQPCQQGAVLFVDYESTAQRIKARLLRVLAGMGLDWGDLPFVYWPGRGRALPEMVPALQRKIRDMRPRLVIVDSAALAAGGEPEKAEVAIRYFNALAALETPSLTIAHVTKDEKADQCPFGSIFWNNSARLAWNVKIEHEDGRNVSHVGLFNRKSNEDRPAAPIGIRVEFEPEAVRFTREELQAGVSDRANLAARIRAELKHGGCSVKGLASALGESQDSLRTRLNQMAGVWRVGRAEDGSGLWGLKANV